MNILKREERERERSDKLRTIESFSLVQLGIVFIYKYEYARSGDGALAPAERHAAEERSRCCTGDLLATEPRAAGEASGAQRAAAAQPRALALDRKMDLKYKTI